MTRASAPPSPATRIISVPAAAERYGVDVRTLRHAIRRRQIPAFKIGRVYRVDVDALDRAFGEHAAAGHRRDVDVDDDVG